ncbi:phage baseplate assembly protein V [Kutzneria chonburiensis]|uniref:Phage baseplate assembly protein V n=1 Tax=Kutzneria chonburiensis TaxID=1483604 RepID=A0ABV6MN33_9PSEU|nr:phage baseplate assembly protein V [Kutzneria chonburiensis]
MSLERIVADLADRVDRRYYGKYRGIVVDNDDPDRLGRLTLQVPSLLGENVVTGWATPCVPYGGAADQGFLFIPEPKAGVWVEFEGGDLECPIWVGTYWSEPDSGGQTPKPQQEDGTEATEVQSPPTRKILRTGKGHTIQLEDKDGEEAVLVQEGVKGHRVVLDQKGIRITDAAGNTVETTESGLKFVDANENSVEMSDSAMKLTAKVPFTIDAAGQPVRIVADSIDLEKG